jgi:hypothetical protein
MAKADQGHVGDAGPDLVEVEGAPAGHAQPADGVVEQRLALKNSARRNRPSRWISV